MRSRLCDRRGSIAMLLAMVFLWAGASGRAADTTPPPVPAPAPTPPPPVVTPQTPPSGSGDASAAAAAAAAARANGAPGADRSTVTSPNVTGLVLDATGKPVVAASVALRDEKKGIEVVAVSDGSGEFAETLPLGVYHVTATREGVGTADAGTVSVGPGAGAHVEVRFGGPLPPEADPKSGDSKKPKRLARPVQNGDRVLTSSFHADAELHDWLRAEDDAGLAILVVLPVAQSRSIFVVRPASASYAYETVSVKRGSQGIRRVSG